jgi:hypothetical protein
LFGEERNNMSSGGLRGFESELDIEERRKKRQEEWEKVRTATDPESELETFFVRFL